MLGVTAYNIGPTLSVLPMALTGGIGTGILASSAISQTAKLSVMDAASRYVRDISSVVRSTVSILSPLKEASDVARAERWNAYVLSRRAEDAEFFAKEQAKAIRRKIRRITSRQASLYAKAGVLLEGSPMEVVADTVREMERSAVGAELSGRRTASRLRGEAEAHRYIGRRAITQGQYGFMRNLLAEASKYRRV